MAEIELTRGYVAQVDDQDYAALTEYQWQAWVGSRTVYAIRSGHIKMHRVIMGARPGLEVDHADGDGLNNRKENLRLCTRSENARNQRKTRGASQFKGVSRHHGRWQAKILGPGSTRVHLGYHDIEADAARAYDDAAREHFGEFACTNFPKGDERPAIERGADLA